MASPTLLLDAAFLLVTASVYWLVGGVTIRRHVGGDGQLAATLFGVWWYALAGLQLVGAGMRVLGYLGMLDLTVYITVTYVLLLVFCAGFWALVYYLSYLLTGNRRLLVPLTAFYIAYYAYLLYYITLSDPVGVKVTDWSVSLDYSNEIRGAPLTLLMLLLVMPPLLGALGYARLYFKVRDPTQKYRIGLVSATLGGWFAILLLAWVLELGTQQWWYFASRAIGVAAALLIYAAFRPPGWVQRRWGIHPVDEASAG